MSRTKKINVLNLVIIFIIIIVKNPNADGKFDSDI